MSCRLSQPATPAPPAGNGGFPKPVSRTLNNKSMASLANSKAIPLPGAVHDSSPASVQDGVKIVAGPSRFTPEKLNRNERCLSTVASSPSRAAVPSARTPVKRFTDRDAFESVESWSTDGHGANEEGGTGRGIKRRGGSGGSHGGGGGGGRGKRAASPERIVSSAAERRTQAEDLETKDKDEIIQRVRGRVSPSDALQKKKAAYLMTTKTSSIPIDSDSAHRVSRARSKERRENSSRIAPRCITNEWQEQIMQFPRKYPVFDLVAPVCRL